MRKISHIFLLIVLIACSSEENIDPRESYFKEAIIGSWAFDTVKLDGETFSYPHTQDCEKDLFQFYNQEGKEFDFEERIVLNCSNCGPCATSSTNLKWELSGDIIKLYFGEKFVTQYKIIEVTETLFVYQIEVDFDDDGDLDILEVSANYYDPFNEFDL